MLGLNPDGCIGLAVIQQVFSSPLRGRQLESWAPTTCCGAWPRPGPNSAGDCREPATACPSRPTSSPNMWRRTTGRWRPSSRCRFPSRGVALGFMPWWSLASLVGWHARYDCAGVDWVEAPEDAPVASASAGVRRPGLDDVDVRRGLISALATTAKLASVSGRLLAASIQMPALEASHSRCVNTTARTEALMGKQSGRCNLEKPFTDVRPGPRPRQTIDPTVLFGRWSTRSMRLPGCGAFVVEAGTPPAWVDVPEHTR